MKSLKFTLILFGGLVLTACHQDLTKKADKIHDKIVSIDTHTDTPFNFLDDNYDVGKWNDFEMTRSRVDFPRMVAGRLDGVFMAVFVSQSIRSDSGNIVAKNKAIQLFNALNEKIRLYPDQAEIVFNAEDIYRTKKAQISAVYIGLENGYPVGNDLNNVKEFYNLGARYITLCHTKNNDICDSSTDKKGPEHNGLSNFGEEVVKEMNRLGMMIDVSHISDSAFYDVLRLTKVPVIASHSSARAICDNPRNLSDEMLLALKDNGGVIQICILSDYIKTPLPYPERDSAFAIIRAKYDDYDHLTDEQREQLHKEWEETDQKYPKELATISDVVDHIDHVVKIIGINYVGIGTDFDGGGGVDGCKDASELKNITIELLRRGYTKEEIEKIWGANFLRVFKEVEKGKKV